MAEDTSTTDAPDATATDPDRSVTTFTQEQVNDLIAKEKGKFQSKYGDYDALKSKAAKLDEIEEANASEIEKAQKQATKAEERAAKAESKLLRFEVAKDKFKDVKVPADAVDLLSGNSREELEASADKILNLVKSRNDNDTPDFDGGAREPAPDAKTPEQAHNELILGLAGIRPDT